MNEMMELAERCERATADMQEALLQEAWTVLFPKPDSKDEPEWRGPGTKREPLFHEWKVRQLVFQALLSVRAFLDAAITLVPEGRHIAHSGEGRFMARGRFAATIETWGMERAEDGTDVHTTPHRHHGVAQTFAFALCAAALRSRAQPLGEDE